MGFTPPGYNIVQSLHIAVSSSIQIGLETQKNESSIMTTIALRLVLPVSQPAALSGTHLTMQHFLVPNRGVAVIRMSNLWILLALRLVRPLSVPAALSCAHLTMHDFGVPDSGVAVIRMRWLHRADS